MNIVISIIAYIVLYMCTNISYVLLKDASEVPDTDLINLSFVNHMIKKCTFVCICTIGYVNHDMQNTLELYKYSICTLKGYFRSIRYWSFEFVVYKSYHQNKFTFICTHANSYIDHNMCYDLYL